MAESLIALTPGSGAKNTHTFNRTINSNSVEDQVVALGDPILPTYIINTTSSISTATSAAHLLQIMAVASLNVYIRRFQMFLSGGAGSAAVPAIQLIRLTTAGSGGTVYTPAPVDTSDSASGCTAQTSPSSKGSEGTSLWFGTVDLPTTSVAGYQSTLLLDVTFPRDISKVPRIAAGTSNGVAFKIITGVASASVVMNVWVEEASY